MKKQWEASFTAELAVLLPIILLALFLPIYTAYDMYDEVKASSVFCWDDSFHAEKKIRTMRLAQEILEGSR